MPGVSAPNTNLPPLNNPEEWIEIFNHTTNTVNLWLGVDGWNQISVPAGKTIAPGNYLVVAQDARLCAGIIQPRYGGKFQRSWAAMIRLSERPARQSRRQVHYFDGDWPNLLVVADRVWSCAIPTRTTPRRKRGRRVMSPENLRGKPIRTAKSRRPAPLRIRIINGGILSWDY